VTDVLVLHDVGDAAAGAPWRAALEVQPPVAARVAPDLPGHGSSPAPRNGAYDPSVVLSAARRAIRDHGLERPLVVGVGANAYAALVLAFGAHLRAVAIVDGLGGRWRDPADEVAAMYARLRRIADDPAATAPSPPEGLDPRAAHGYDNSTAPWFARHFWGQLDLPVLVVETPASPTPASERAERAAWFGGPATLVELDDPSPASVVAAVVAWQHA
jgi:pimeloyl-ACP methyl ester carboxylesterase